VRTPALARVPPLIVSQHTRRQEVHRPDRHREVRHDQAPCTILPHPSSSSDLWVDGSVPNSQKTGESGNVTYAKGSASGPIKTAALVVAGITVSDQAFIEADTDSTNSPGIFGLGPATGSIVYQTFAGQADAAPPLDRIFALNSSSEGYITSTLVFFSL
jgi:hypothetical protein